MYVTPPRRRRALAADRAARDAAPSSGPAVRDAARVMNRSAIRMITFSTNAPTIGV